MVLIDHIASLKKQSFQKLIIGAALKDFQSIEDYAYYFTHAQANVIDISAFPHSVISAKKGIERALLQDPLLKEPLIMVSVNIGEDPHFRRIELDVESCTECLDCLPTCPSGAFSVIARKAEPDEAISKSRHCEEQSDEAISPKDALDDGQFSYNIDLCFGCANCLPACTDKALSFKNWNSFDTQSLKELIELGASAIELHLNHDLEGFKNFYEDLPKSFLLESFCIGSNTANKNDLHQAVDSIIESVFTKHEKDYRFVIQTDGIPLSGARDLKIENKDQLSIDKAKLVIDYIHDKYSNLKEQIFIQLAGGTDETSLKKALSQKISVSGVAIGSYARKKIKDTTETQEAILIDKKLVQSENFN